MQAHSLSKLVSGWFADAGIKSAAYDGRSAHAFRHTFAQDLVDAGAELRKLQTALGHRSIGTTELYLRRQPPGLAEMMEGRSY